MRSLLRSNSQDLNLKRIYNNQSVSEELLSIILKLAIHVRETLMDEDFREGVANVTSFAKQKKCWDKIKDISYDLSIPSIDSLNNQEIEDNEFEREQTAGGWRAD